MYSQFHALSKEQDGNRWDTTMVAKDVFCKLHMNSEVR